MMNGTPSRPRFGIRRERTAITMSDGVRLAATLYLPDGAPEGERFRRCSSSCLMNGRTVRQKEWEERIPRDGI